MQGAGRQAAAACCRARAKGRVALLLSDHIWLWARGYRGRRAASRPAAPAVALADEAARPRGGGAAPARARPRPRGASARPWPRPSSEVTLTTPSGKTRTLTLDRRPSPACGAATIEANELGLWRATDGKLTALANVGPANPREFTEVTSTTDVLAPLASATGGDVAPHRGRQSASPCRASSRCARATPTRATTGSG